MGRIVDALRVDLRLSGRPTWRYGLMCMLAARRRDELAEGAGDTMTSLRRGIRHAAAAQPALRGLSAEAVRLASLTAPRTRQPRSSAA